MILQKWDYQTHTYEPYEVPDDKTIILYTQNMDLPINCASCLRDMVYGEGFTSRTIHNHSGLGFPVCEDCYEKEIEAEREAKG